MTLAPLTIDDTERMAELVETYASVGDRALIDDVLADYPDLERDDLLAALEFGTLLSGVR
jgi:uncharacterized protein (DUF433 family)